MISYSVQIPDEKQSFFQEFLDVIGADYKKENSVSEKEKSQENVEIPEWHNKIVEERLADYRENPKNNMNFDDLLKDLRKKYSL
ncbi:Putative addiction module component [Halpernia humi]|uniref:Putative addiction module component n=1 Tax=Halpernia humi TaxID=493375 RepID=A0A1H5WA55_9FLAO|nr:addiction module protein [Halpernia humi]SEF96283.1 Putative addiction module component [Halpernia humi]